MSASKPRSAIRAAFAIFAISSASLIARRLSTRPSVGTSSALPELNRDANVLNHFVNMLAHNTNGTEPPDKAGRDEGYLFWLAWLQHNGAALFSTSDANGPFRPVTLGGTCGVLDRLRATARK